ncbi:MAG: NfeD family protein [Oscillospiraceae bacterium]|nr:NfeD family protein [Oscillospiraceae bacterium]
MDVYAWVWLVLLLGFIILETMTAQLVALWFILGSAAAFFMALLDVPFVWQAAVFFAVSVAALLILRPLVRDKVAVKAVPTNADMVIGRVAVVTEDVDNDLAKGRAEANGLSWSARSLDGAILKKGTKATVYAIDGVKLILQQIKED